MTVYEEIIGVSWLIFIAYWAFSAVGIKKNVSNNMGRWFGSRVVLVLIALILARLKVFNVLDLGYHGGLNPLAAFIGVILCVSGIVFAIWSRYHLGRNWGMPMSLKENPELVTTGPYAYVRHPIYTGLLFAVFGSALTVNAEYFLFFILAFIYFVYSARIEEKLMLKQFPVQYKDYMQRKKMLIPFII